MMANTNQQEDTMSKQKEPTPATLRIAATYLETAENNPLRACRDVVKQLTDDGSTTSMAVLAPVLVVLSRIAFEEIT